MDYNIIIGKSTLTNTGDVYSGTLSVGVTTYTDNGIYLCKLSATNTTTTPTINLNGIGAKTIVLNNGSAVSVGALLIDSWCLFMYSLSADKFLLINSNATTPVKRYKVNLTYVVGTPDTIVATELENDLGVVSVNIIDNFSFNLICTNAFPDASKVFQLSGKAFGSGVPFSKTWVDSSTLLCYSDGGITSLNYTGFLVEVYI